MADEKYYYIEKCYSLTKEDYFSPWLMKYSHPLDNQNLVSVYLENRYAQAGDFIEKIPVVGVGEDFQYILDSIFPNITSYPYAWPFEGSKIDINGYDFKSNTAKQTDDQFIEIVDSARTLIWEALNIEAPLPPLEFDVTKPEEVAGAFLSKLELTFEKAGPVSTLAFDVYSLKPIKIASIVYLSDTTRYVVPKKINLDLASIEQDDYTYRLKLAKPVFAKRFIIVLAQNNASQNAFSFKKDRLENLTKYAKKITNGKYLDKSTVDTSHWSNTLSKSIEAYNNGEE